MSSKHFSWLLVATVIATALVLVIPGKTGKESSLVRTTLVPGLAEQVNEIDWLQLSGAGGEVIVTLERTNSAWVVKENSDYRAEWSRVKNLLNSLSQAEVIEEKTSKPEFYSRLGVEDVASDQAAGVMVRFSGGSGLPAVIIGNSAEGREGQYARIEGSAASVLIDRRIDMPESQVDWLDKTIVDITDAEVVQFEIVHADGESITATRASADDEDFDLQGVPQGREVETNWTVNAPANSLAALDLQSVVPATRMNWENATRFMLLTADGLMVETELLAIPGADGESEQTEHWIKIAAGVYTTGVGTLVEGETNNPETLARAEEINNRVNGWAYRIPGYKYDSMTRRMDDFLQPAAEE